jgi:hypothetical protein
MRSLARAASFILLACAACDKPEPPPPPEPEPPPPAPIAAADAAPSPRAERPVPLPQTMVSASAPIEVQQKAIGYMVAMRAPRPGDADSNPAYAEALVAKLRPILRAMDTGANKARLNRIEIQANGRQIDLLMADGCDAKTPFRAVVTRAGFPLPTLAANGIFVVRCNDAKIQCLQSTREPDDVLCTTAPRKK